MGCGMVRYGAGTAAVAMQSLCYTYSTSSDDNGTCADDSIRTAEDAGAKPVVALAAAEAAAAAAAADLTAVVAAAAAAVAADISTVVPA